MREYVTSLPIIKLSALKKILFAAIFTALSVATPWVCHQFGIAGQIFLPMHFFVLVAGLLCGWQVGLLAGVITPLVSYLTSGMPLLPVLPQISLEIAVYGFTAGILCEIFKQKVFTSLIIAMLLGRLALGLFVFAVKGIDPLVTIQGVITVGWPGILMQIILLPFVVKKIIKFLNEYV